jgi:hypothetical protein
MRLRTIASVFAVSGAALACASIAGISAAELDADVCQSYCRAVLDACTDEFEVYTSLGVCLDYCATLSPGEPGDDSGNTVNCRLTHARNIADIGEELVNCPIAGPGGNGVCGSNCEGFCTAHRAICDPELSEQACLNACGKLEDTGGYVTSQQSGNTVQCRLYHVSAATISVDPHCSHAAGASPCIANP